jgi:phenylalanyl-tRNA synthetase beta chain
MIKIPISWLKEFVDIIWTPEQIAAGLTLRGLEVEGIIKVGEDWDNVVVGEVISTADHPNADRLAVVQISDGTQTYQVITGAKNLKPGDKCPLALPGAKLIDGHKLHDEGRIEGALKKRRNELPFFTVKTGKMRGVESNAVACAELELGVSEAFDEIMVLEADAPTGRPLQEVLGDIIIELDISPNLGRALSIYGVAREVAAMTGQKVRFPEIKVEESGAPVQEKINIRVETDLCPRFSMMVIEGIKLGQSPKWMQRRLRATDQPVINNIVDVTNYVMLEIGQPLHSFDYDQIGGKQLIIRRAEVGEQLETIDHIVRELNPEIVVVADASRARALAGVMGGADSEISDTTVNVALEGANWNAFNIRATSRGMFSKQSEAAKRFERTVDVELTVLGVKRGIQLMHLIAGGTVAKGIIDIYPDPKPLRTLDLPLSEIPRLLGISVPKTDVIGMLEKLEFKMEDLGNDILRVTVPSYRNDVTIKADLVEEVARQHGYDKIPETMLRGELPPQKTNYPLLVENNVRKILTGCGVNEIVSYSLISRESLQNVGYSADNLIAVTNPLSSEHEIMRPLMLPALLRAMSENRRFNEQVFVFEIGRTYLAEAQNSLAKETRTLSIGMSGLRDNLSRFIPLKNNEMVDFFDLKGVIEELFTRLYVRGVNFEGMPESENIGLHPGRAANILLNGDKIGYLGEVHPKIADKFELPMERLAVAEINLEKILPLIRLENYRNVPRLQTVSQDLAIILAEDTIAANVEKLIRETGGSMLVNVTLFDIYRGKPIPEGKKSLAYRMYFQPEDRTLTEAEVTKLREKIEKRLSRELGAEFRS